MGRTLKHSKYQDDDPEEYFEDVELSRAKYRRSEIKRLQKHHKYLTNELDED
jgi:hypothetical protein